jgi:hypothetical protein
MRRWNNELEAMMPHAPARAIRSYGDAIAVLPDELAVELEAVAGPGDVPEGGVLPEDVVVRLSPGEPVAPMVARVTSEATWANSDDLSDAEYGPPGYYARVAPYNRQRSMTAPRYRRVLDHRGRLVQHTILLRPRHAALYTRPRTPLPGVPYYRWPRPHRPVVVQRRVSPPRAPTAFAQPQPSQLLVREEPGLFDPQEPVGLHNALAPSEPRYSAEPFDPGFDDPEPSLDPAEPWATANDDSPQDAEAFSGLRSRIADTARKELTRWDGGRRKESAPELEGTLRAYWLTVRSRDAANDAIARGLPWSAAFVSWVIREAGAGDAFSYSGLHTAYVAAAKRSRLRNDAAKFWAYDITEAKPEVGDIVCRNREQNGVCSGTTYANVDDGQERATHCDIVVAIDSRRVTCIGGNLSDSVREAHYALGADGFLLATPKTGCRLYALVKPPTDAIGRSDAFALPQRLTQAVQSGVISAAIASEIASGSMTVTQLTDRIFAERHPELAGRKLAPHETALTQEWIAIREQIARPLIGART